MSDETRKKMSESAKGKIRSEEHCRNLSIANSGKKLSIETRQKISNSSKGRTAWNKGIKMNLSDDARKRMGDSWRGRKHTEEEKKKISESQIGEKNHAFGTHKTIEEKKNLSEKLSGDKSPHWRGGISYGDYGVDFNKHLKTEIRHMDGFKCCQCLIHQDDMYDKRGSKYSLNIHHVDYDKHNNNKNNLISLCSSCHSKTNYNREMWTKHFVEIINNGRGYDI